MQTIWTWIVLSEALFALLLGIVWNLRRTEQALIYWAIASACLAVGALGISLRGKLPDLLSIPVANTLFALTWSLRWAGLRRFAGQPLRRHWYLGPPLALGLLFLLREPVGLETAARVALVAAIGGAYALLMIVDAWRAQRDERLVMRRIVIGTSLFTVIGEAALALLSLQSEPGQHFLSQNAVNATVLLGLMSVFALYDLSCFLMVFERHENRLVRAATVDSLTNLLNRAGFSQLSNRQLQRSHRDGKPVSLLVMDLDYFKKVNDHYGHEAGDAVLRAFAQAARAALRPTDLVARSGGEEFWALLPKTDLAEACRIAQRVCDSFRETRVPFDGQQIAATASIGVAEVALQTETIQATLARADQALYAAKHAGRDRVVAAEPPSRGTAPG